MDKGKANRKPPPALKPTGSPKSSIPQSQPSPFVQSSSEESEPEVAPTSPTASQNPPLRPSARTRSKSPSKPPAPEGEKQNPILPVQKEPPRRKRARSPSKTPAPEPKRRTKKAADEGDFLVRLRDEESLDWKETGRRFSERFGKTLTENTLKNKYREARAAAAALSAAQPIVQSAENTAAGPVPREIPALPPPQATPAAGAPEVTPSIEVEEEALEPPSHPHVGGKTITPAYRDAIIASQWHDTETNPSRQSSRSPSPQSSRSPSPISPSDTTFFEYSVRTKSWRHADNEAHIDWLCSGTHTFHSLDEANEVAERTTGNFRRRLAGRVRRVEMTFSEGMVRWLGECDEGFFKIVVGRTLVVPGEGRVPGTKRGWAGKRLWEVKCRAVEGTGAVGGGGEEPEGLFSVLGQANHAAVGLAVELSTRGGGARMDEVLARQGMKMRLWELVREAEAENRPFRVEVEGKDGGRFEVWVRERKVVGPRNM